MKSRRPKVKAERERLAYELCLQGYANYEIKAIFHKQFQANVSITAIGRMIESGRANYLPVHLSADRRQTTVHRYELILQRLSLKIDKGDVPACALATKINEYLCALDGAPTLRNPLPARSVSGDTPASSYEAFGLPDALVRATNVLEAEFQDLSNENT